MQQQAGSDTWAGTPQCLMMLMAPAASAGASHARCTQVVIIYCGFMFHMRLSQGKRQFAGLWQVLLCHVNDDDVP
jgi:hypothetical protein